MIINPDQFKDIYCQNSITKIVYKLILIQHLSYLYSSYDSNVKNPRSYKMPKSKAVKIALLGCGKLGQGLFKLWKENFSKGK